LKALQTLPFASFPFVDLNLYPFAIIKLILSIVFFLSSVSI
jgi:hypothetical protein